VPESKYVVRELINCKFGIVPRIEWANRWQFPAEEIPVTFGKIDSIGRVKGFVWVVHNSRHEMNILVSRKISGSQITLLE